MLKLLVPVDGSEASTRAVKAALELAKLDPHTVLHILTAPTPIVSGNVRRFFAEDVLNAYYQEEGENALAAARALTHNTGITVHEAIVPGNTAEVIKNYAQEHGCNHIVMGTRGLNALPGLILGSVTTKVIHAVDIPVTLIK